MTGLSKREQKIYDWAIEAIDFIADYAEINEDEEMYRTAVEGYNDFVIKCAELAAMARSRTTDDEPLMKPIPQMDKDDVEFVEYSAACPEGTRWVKHV